MVGAIVGIVYATYGTPPPPLESLKDAMVPPPLPPPPAYTLGQSRATDVRDDGRIRAVLAAYLAHEFQAHKQQSVAVDPCTIQIIGTLATAKCEGVIEDIRKDGGAVVQSRKTSWSFVLERVSRNWQITDASVK